MRRTVYGCKGEAIPGTGTFVGPAGCADRTSSFELSDSSGMSRARRGIYTGCGLEVHKSLRKGLPGRSESPLSIESSGFVWNSASGYGCCASQAPDCSILYSQQDRVPCYFDPWCHPLPDVCPPMSLAPPRERFQEALLSM